MKLCCPPCGNGPWRAFLLTGLLLSALHGGGALAHGNTTPLHIPGVRVVSAGQAQALIAKGARIVDTRSIHDFLAGHIPDALHVVYREYSARQVEFDARQDGVARFLKRLRRYTGENDTLIFYCNGVQCWKSFKAVVVAERDGFRHLYWLRGGITEWKAQGLPIVVE